MKIISLNTWGGRAGREGLLAFFGAHKHDTDIFCLQEMWSAPYDTLDGQQAGGMTLDQTNIMVHGLTDIGAVLTDFVPYFRPHHGDHYGLLMFVRKNLEVKVEGEIFVYKHKGYSPEGDIGNHARNIQFITIEHNGEPLTVVNFHGLWNGQGKTDSEDRITQSEKIAEFVKQTLGDIVMLGDFNLLPDTQSIRIIEDVSLRNLIREYGITSTRTSHYTKPEKFADYAFTSKGIEVTDFRVLPDEVSDHSPLLLVIK